MYDVVKYNISKNENLEKLRLFLKSNNLTLDKIDTAYVIEENSEIIACVCKDRNVLKCFAIDDQYQGMNFTDKLMTSVFSERLGNEDYFIFTKVENRSVFMDYGFKPVHETTKVSLLHYGPNTIENVLSSMTKVNKETGAIVMNLNPMTLGHLYLIEEAYKQVEHLIIFVVEQDDSQYSFKDRMELVRKNTEHLKNISIFPSTMYIISAATFPTYFLKEQKIIERQQALLDIGIFGHYFAPYFSIKKRFVGNEPFDVTTAMYNEQMKSILPSYGVEVVEVSRKMMGEEIISASRVRKLINERKWDKVKEIVPKATYEFLCKQHLGC